MTELEGFIGSWREENKTGYDELASAIGNCLKNEVASLQKKCVYSGLLVHKLIMKHIEEFYILLIYKF